MPRPFKHNVARYASGRSRGVVTPEDPYNTTNVTQAEVVFEGKLLRLRKRVPELERLHSEGRIREHQRIAGEWYASLVRRYRMLIGAPPPAAAVSQPEGPQGGTPLDPDILPYERQQAMLDEYNKLWREHDRLYVLLTKGWQGMSIKRAVDALCLDDIVGNHLELARRGLQLLAEHRGLVPRRY